MNFESGQTFSILGQNYKLEITRKTSGNVKAIVNDQKIDLVISEKHVQMKNEIIKRTIIKFFREKLKERIERINSEYFRSDLGQTTIREASSRWGSCSAKNDIMISLRLLFMPLEIIDYVIVHELAHTKYRGHGVRFWQYVEKVMPDFRDKKEWLKKNGNSYPKLENSKIEQKTIEDFCDEPY
jgi:predicted metal-dependent hydrolase